MLIQVSVEREFFLVLSVFFFCLFKVVEESKINKQINKTRTQAGECDKKRHNEWELNLRVIFFYNST